MCAGSRMGSGIVLILTALSAGGCTPTGPSGELTGTWTSSERVGSPRDAVDILTGLTLQQTDGEVRGTACQRVNSAPIFERVFYQAVPVTGEYPRVEFTVLSGHTLPGYTALAGTRFSGRLGNSGDIVGRLIGAVDNKLIRFERSTTDVCR